MKKFQQTFIKVQITKGTKTVFSYGETVVFYTQKFQNFLSHLFVPIQKTPLLTGGN
jgi:hypothetical protein